MKYWLPLTFCQLTFLATNAVASSDAHAAAGHVAWGTLVFPVLNFSLFLFLFSILIRKFVLPAIESRKEHIEIDLDESTAAADEASGQLKSLRTRLENIDGEKNEILTELDAQGRKMAQVIIANGRETAKRMAEETSRHIVSEQARASAEVRRELILEASRLAREEIVKEMTPEVERRVRDKVLDAL
jgi:F0F1-type ATP synthase membrane subunit b/b'